MMFNVFVVRKISGEGVDFLEGKGCRIIKSNYKTIRDDPGLATCHAILDGGPFGINYDDDFFSRAPNLRIIGNFSAGYERVDTNAAGKYGVQVTNSGNANSQAVAEHTLYLILACAKKAQIMRNTALRGEYSVLKKIYNVELRGKTLGVLGFGNIGRLVAEKAHFGFDMKIKTLFHKNIPENLPEYITAASTIKELSESSDFLSIHLPLNEHTGHIINKRFLENMKKGAYLINTSRGGLVDETALVRALDEGRLSGAGLDVFEKEPVSPQNPLLNRENVIVSPHCGASTKEALATMELFAAEDIWRVLNGENPEFPVNHPDTVKSGSADC